MIANLTGRKAQTQLRPPISVKTAAPKLQIKRRRSPTFAQPRQSVLRYSWAKLFLQDQIAKGKTHPTAVRASSLLNGPSFQGWRDHLPYGKALMLTASYRGSLLTSKLELLFAKQQVHAQ